MTWLNAEPAPGRTPPALARQFNYGIFSARTANIYTAAQLSAWTALATSPEAAARVEIWADSARFRDALRPGIQPDGFASEAEARASLTTTAWAFRRTIEQADAHVFRNYGYDQTRQHLDDSIERMRQLNGDLQILLNAACLSYLG